MLAASARRVWSSDSREASNASSWGIVMDEVPDPEGEEGVVLEEEPVPDGEEVLVEEGGMKEPPPPPPPPEEGVVTTGAVTVTVVFAVTVPEAFFAVRVYVVVCVGDTETDEPVVVPTPLFTLVVGSGVPPTSQERTEDCPSVIDPGFAVKEMIVGGISGVEVGVLVGVFGRGRVEIFRGREELEVFPLESYEETE